MPLVERQSPYLVHPDRLADVVAAIQVMSTFKFSNRDIAKWEETIGRAPKSSPSWLSIFEHHPEFFRVTDGKVSLIWRRAYERVYDTVLGKELSSEQIQGLSEKAREDLSRRPLSSEQTTALIEVAIKLQTQAIARRQELRWWVPCHHWRPGFAARRTSKVVRPRSIPRSAPQRLFS
jgi:hypothetical protein